MPYGDKDLNEQWLQAIIWTNVGFSSVKVSGIDPRTIFSEYPSYYSV